MATQRRYSVRRLVRTATVGTVVVAWSVAPLSVGAATLESAHTLPSPSTSSCEPTRSGILTQAPTVPSGARTIALTFDDGPGRSTNAILKILTAFGVRATFFNIGENESWYPNQVRAEARDGFLIGNHSWNHPDLALLDRSGQAQQLAWEIGEQHALVGSQPCVFRPPYGDATATTLAVARADHMSVWDWSASTDDWQADGSGSTAWVTRIVHNAESEAGAQTHPVLLMHNQGIAMPATVAALPTIIEYFERHHYVFVDLLGRSGPVGTCGPATSSPASTLASGVTLSSGASVSSPSGQFHLTMEPSGVLALTTDGHRLWSTSTAGHPGATASVQSDGTLAVTSGARVVWTSSPGGAAGDHLEIRDDGNVALVLHGTTDWSSGTTLTRLIAGGVLRPGWSLESPDHSCRLTLTTAGQLTVTGTSGQLWRSPVKAGAHSQLRITSTGNVELLSAHHVVTWITNTGGQRGAALTMLASGELVVQVNHGPWLWSSG